MPKLKHQKVPQLRLMVDITPKVIINQSLDRRRFEVAALDSLAAQQGVTQKIAQLPSEPMLQGNAESHLAPSENLSGQEVF